jgi:hypothetical protein
MLLLLHFTMADSVFISHLPFVFQLNRSALLCAIRAPSGLFRYQVLNIKVHQTPHGSSYQGPIPK